METNQWSNNHGKGRNCRSSGLDDPGILSNPEVIQADTPFGKPSSALSVGKINGVDVVLIARHGEKHKLSPSQVNYRANIYALKDRGADSYPCNNGLWQS